MIGGRCMNICRPEEKAAKIGADQYGIDTSSCGLLPILPREGRVLYLIRMEIAKSVKEGAERGAKKVPTAIRPDIGRVTRICHVIPIATNDMHRRRGWQPVGK